MCVCVCVEGGGGGGEGEGRSSLFTLSLKYHEAGGSYIITVGDSSLSPPLSASMY